MPASTRYRNHQYRLSIRLTRDPALQATMEETDVGRIRRFKHVFLDAEGTLYVPKNGLSRWYFWARPTPEDAVKFFELDKGVVPALEKLRLEVDTLCLVSLNSKPVLDAILDHFDIRKYFDCVMVNGNKGERIEKYLDERGLRKDDSVMVGDTPSLDLDPVLRAGIYAILVDRDYNRNARAERIKGVYELPSWLRLADIAERMMRDSARIAKLDEFGEILPARLASTKSLIAAAGA
jgi:phosphoglycolate phosphatase-like HAD superfamily hydrolase